jgi:L-aspartate oxidase
MDKEHTDFLVIGSGVAGLRAAIELSPHGDVLVVTKDMPQESSTEYAQGGIAVALSDEDEVGIHYKDTLKAGDGLCNEEAVKILVNEGPERIMELISWGAAFDREGTKLAFTLEAAHSRKRVLHAHGDATGKELERVLLKKVRSLKSVRRYPFTMVVDLIVKDGSCIGIYVIKERKFTAIYSRATVLASGGGGQIFSITTNPPVATADGMAIAYRAGAALEDMEFVQFHPTSLYHPSAPHFLLTEAMRGEGGILRNIKKKTFMKKYHPMAELAPRDVVSRAIISEMVKTKSSHVYLDLRHLGGSFVKKRFPRIYSTCLKFDVDITKDLIPVCPAAHYMMGGVKTDTDGRTNIKGLFAAGEAACTGVHGANRLASNSLLEGLVYGKRAGGSAVKFPLDKGALRKAPEPSIPALHSIPDHDEIRGALRRLMWERAGIIRCEESLLEAKYRLAEWKFILEKNFYTRRELELKNMLGVATIITEAALQRKGSVGAHFRSDCPTKGRNWKRHIEWSKK